MTDSISRVAAFLLERDEALGPGDSDAAEREESARCILALAASPQPVVGDRELSEALDFLRDGLQFAYAKGLHEVGYDPIQRVLASLASRPEGGWRPIETAPKDGTPFVFMIAGGRRGIAFIDPREHEGLRFFSSNATIVGPDPYNQGRVGMAMSSNYLDDATHWMPLPPPPSGEGG